MEQFLAKVTTQAMNYAIRSGLTITTTYAMKQFGHLLRNVEGTEKEELASLQMRLESKIRIISPAIDMIELIAARGNTTLESAITLTKALRWDIQSLGQRLATAAADEALIRRGSSRAKPKAQTDLELRFIVSEIKKLLARIEDAVPMINLAITTSGARLSTSLPATVSPSRLLQASTFLTAGDTEYTMQSQGYSQVGPSFTLTMYMLFEGYARDLANSDPANEAHVHARETVWKEVLHKARVKLMRVPLDKLHEFPEHGYDYGPAARNQGYLRASKGNEFAYQIVIIEDWDDDRVHTLEEGESYPGPFGGVAHAGIREIIPIHEISKIFYADTGKLLGIGSDRGETDSPILLLKRDVNAIPPRRMMERETPKPEPYGEASPEEDDVDEEQSEVDAQLRRESSVDPSVEEPEAAQCHDHDKWRLPPNLDPEWIAFEVYTEQFDSDTESEVATEEPVSSPPSSSRNDQKSSSPARSTTPVPASSPPQTPNSYPVTHYSLNNLDVPSSTTPTPLHLTALRTSLSLLEMLIRLTSLQQFQQTSHLAIPDELLTFFLSESSSTGAGADQERRQMMRNRARQKVGFDPYDESPIKFHGEAYQTTGAEGFDEAGYEGSFYGYDGFNRAGSVDPNAPLPSREMGLPARMPSVGADSPSYRKMPSRSRPGTPKRAEFVKRGTPGTGRGGSVSGIRSPLAREIGSAREDGRNAGNDSALGTSPAADADGK